MNVAIPDDELVGKDREDRRATPPLPAGSPGGSPITGQTHGPTTGHQTVPCRWPAIRSKGFHGDDDAAGFRYEEHHTRAPLRVSSGVGTARYPRRTN